MANQEETKLPDNTGKIQEEVGNKKPPKEYQFKPGQSGNPAGKPKGSISAIAKVKKIFQDNPKEFKKFIKEYIKDPANRKHIVEMIDGKPKLAVDINLEGRVEIDNLAKDVKDLLSKNGEDN